MMLVLILMISANIVALCAGSAIPVIPGDNSHYVEGESRYIWMPDGDGVPHLVDLHGHIQNDSSRSGAYNEYWLFTRSNPTNAQIIIHGDQNSIYSSNYLASRELKIVLHGWTGNGHSISNELITSGLLDSGDFNVIVVDWSSVATLNYISASLGVPDVGQFLGNFLVWLVNTTGVDWNNVHIIGVSLGSHVAGYAGRTANGLPGRITGLDPAGPLWQNNDNSLNPNDGVYVESIHTDGGLLGILYPISDVDFYPNGGLHPQPGCDTSLCSHGRAVQFFASSVRTDHFVGYRCVNLEQALDNVCSGTTLNMGNTKMSKRGSGIFALVTGSSFPF